jgi:hypothetical protein
MMHVTTQQNRNQAGSSVHAPEQSPSLLLPRSSSHCWGSHECFIYSGERHSPGWQTTGAVPPYSSSARWCRLSCRRQLATGFQTLSCGERSNSAESLRHGATRLQGRRIVTSIHLRYDFIMDVLSQVRGHALVDAAQNRLSRNLSLDERGELVRAACRSAARLYASRIASGLPPRVREEWPRSTWDFLNRHARRIASERAPT